jgi:hypothetical protein
MKTAKALCATMFLALSLSIPAYAEDTNPGDVHSPGKPCPITCDSGSSDRPSNEPCGETTDTGDSSFPNLADILWVVASIF